MLSLQEGEFLCMVGIMHNLLGHWQRNPHEIQTITVVDFQSKAEEARAIIFFANHWCLERTSVSNQKQFSLVINNVSKAKSIAILVVSTSFQRFNYSPLSLKFFLLTSFPP